MGTEHKEGMMDRVKQGSDGAASGSKTAGLEDSKYQDRNSYYLFLSMTRLYSALSMHRNFHARGGKRQGKKSYRRRSLLSWKLSRGQAYEGNRLSVRSAGYENYLRRTKWKGKYQMLTRSHKPILPVGSVE